MSYLVCISTAGTGSRLGSLTQSMNKSMLTVANQPVISRIINQFPSDARFVIALGYQGELVREYLTLAHANREFYFVEVDRYEGIGSGLGYSLLCCKKLLQEPFVFCSCDTLTTTSIPFPKHNWMGGARVDDLGQYRTFRIANRQGNTILDILEKNQSTEDCLAYIGLAGINDYELFWDAMETGGNVAIEQGESYGLRALISRGLQGHEMSWFDTGSPHELEKTRRILQQPDAPNILDKPGEAIWFIGNRVVKYSADEKFILNRVDRVSELSGYVPNITGHSKHFYCYEKVEGEILSEAVTLPLFEKLLDGCREFWRHVSLTHEEAERFSHDCLRFYKDKTIERVNLFYRNFDRADGQEIINGIPMPTLLKLLEKIDWNWLSEGLPGRFHGDFHFENILYDHANEKFVFLDWRQDFAGSLSTGDIYYDFAKLKHGLIIAHDLILANQFNIDWGEKEIKYGFLRKQILVECESLLDGWLVANHFDRKKVYTLTALIYLNIAALHHYPYSLLLYVLGKTMLNNSLNQPEEIYGR